MNAGFFDRRRIKGHATPLEIPALIVLIHLL